MAVSECSESKGKGGQGSLPVCYSETYQGNVSDEPGLSTTEGKSPYEVLLLPQDLGKITHSARYTVIPYFLPSLPFLPHGLSRNLVLGPLGTDTASFCF